MTLSGVLTQFNVFPGSKDIWTRRDTEIYACRERAAQGQSGTAAALEEAQSAADPFILDFQ